MTDRELDAYLAGLFDGEGWVGITNTALATRADSYVLRMAVVMVDREPVALFHARWGGNLYALTPKNPRHREQFKWQATGDKAVTALEAMMPFLTVKHEQAELGIAFQARKIGTGRIPLASNELAIRADYKQRMSALKGR